jgi:hypothetical protein
MAEIGEILEAKMNRFVSVQVKCAGCGAQFGEANHRFVLHDERTDLLTLNVALYSVRKFEPSSQLTDFDYPVCGESCLQKLEGKLISGQKL